MSKTNRNRKKDAPKTTIVEGRLTINCGGCKNGSSLNDRNCILCICRHVKTMGTVSSITLSSSTDVSMDEGAIASFRELAFVYRMMSENRSERKGKKCARCRRSFTSLVKDQLPNFPDVNIPLLRDRMTQMQFTDPVCSLCASDTVKLIDTLRESLDNVCISRSCLELEAD